MKLLTAFVLAIGILAIDAKADQSTVSQLNELVRGEISAVETYRQALEKSDGIVGAETLREHHDNHVKHLEILQREVRKLGGTPSTESGAWGVWAQTVTGSAKILGDEASLKALRAGEQHGVEEYQELLKNENVPADVKSLVRSDLLPQQQEHVTKLDQMINKL